MKVNVLGTEYEVAKDVKREDDQQLENADGYIDNHDKKIVIADIEESPGMTNDIEDYKRHIFRHELIHAFFYESGLTDYSNDEFITEYLAVQIPKMSKLFEELNI